jgi:hypothetical protein
MDELGSQLPLFRADDRTTHELELEELVVRAVGGLAQCRRIADFGDLPRNRQPDVMRDLCRYIVGSPIE